MELLKPERVDTFLSSQIRIAMLIWANGDCDSEGPLKVNRVGD